MEKTENRLPSRRNVLSMGYEQYEAAMSTSQEARNCLTKQMKTHPEIFPTAMAQGHKFHGWTEVSKKMPNIVSLSQKLNLHYSTLFKVVFGHQFTNPFYLSKKPMQKRPFPLPYSHEQSPQKTGH
ncbi:MAG: hypothetical protein GY805_11855 [Chloroflexi bacterium]|nr:hypothetical protein [Chloroflexota bacterium]